MFPLLLADLSIATPACLKMYGLRVTAVILVVVAQYSLQATFDIATGLCDAPYNELGREVM